MASPPTITTSTSFPSGTHASTAKLWATTPAAFFFQGGWVETYATDYRRFPVATPSFGTVGRNVWRAWVRANTSILAWRVLGYTAKYRLLVADADGGNPRYVDKTGTDTASTTGINYIKLDFTSAGGKATRVLGIEGEIDSGITGAYCVFSEVIDAPPSPELFRLIIVGDSFVNGANATRRGDCFALQGGRKLGVHDNWLSGLPGTGYLNDVSGTRYTLRQRLSDITGNSPNAVAICMGTNDTSADQTALLAEVTATLSALRAALPAVPVFVFGPWDYGAPVPASANHLATTATIAAAVSGRSGMWFIPATGVAFSQVGGGDTHPDTAGHTTLGEFLRDQINAILGVA